MALYEARSILIASDIKDVISRTFTMIGKMDKANRHLSELLDQKLRSIAVKNTVSQEDIHETDLLRKAVDALSSSKVQLAVKNYDLIDQNIKVVDHEIVLLERALIDSGELDFVEDSSSSGTTFASGKKGTSHKKRKLDSSSNLNNLGSDCSVDPNEPVYCVCNRIAFGDMIACDNEECPIEWFHYTCVNLTKKPRNTWICPTCTNKKKK